MHVSVVIPTRDRPAMVAQLASALRDQLRDGDEVVVIDQSEHPSALRGVRHHVTDTRGLAAARALGLALTSGAVVLFLDDDTWPLPGLVDGHRAAFADPWVGVSAGRVVERHLRPNARGPRNDVALSGRVRTDLTRWAPGEVATAKGANMAVRRAAVAATGRFDPGYTGTAFLEDADWSIRAVAAGWRLVWTPDAAVVHHSAPSGGCRATARDAERARFYNTGRFVRRHRAWSVGAAALTFAAIAARRAASWRDPSAAPALLADLARGWRDGAAP